jgi:predicted metal-binding protein
MTESAAGEPSQAPTEARPPERRAAWAEIIACESCGNAERDASGRTRGEGLLAELRGLRAAAGAKGGPSCVEVGSVRCLWACGRSCTVALRSPGRVGYVIAGLEPTALSAQSLLEFAALYAGSESGAVPYKQWPAALKGHFLCRFPAAPLSATPPLDSRPNSLQPGSGARPEDSGEFDLPPEAALP